jgi:outer membrane immunogenic protein
MKNLLLGTSVLAGLLLAGAAQAADIPLKAQRAAPPFWSWTGCYIGGHVGWARGDSDVVDVDGYAAAASDGTVTSVSKSGVFGGGQLGCNWQTGTFVFGLEGDIGFMDIGRTTPLTGTVSGTRIGIHSGAYGDITGRLGVAVGNALLYGKGGVAFYDRIPTFSTVSGSFSSVSFPGVSTGWTAGAGIEYQLGGPWSVKVEYLHFKFDDGDFTVFNAVGTPFRFRQDLSIDTVKFGINYSFGGPLFARY